MQNNRNVGTIKENLAAAHLEEKGLIVLSKNYRCRYGEIDIVAKDGRYLVFVEVKYRANSSMGFPQEAVTKKKQKTISFVAKYYMMQNHLEPDIPVRFDVVAILGDDITHIENAFYMT